LLDPKLLRQHHGIWKRIRFETMRIIRSKIFDWKPKFYRSLPLSECCAPMPYRKRAVKWLGVVVVWMERNKTMRILSALVALAVLGLPGTSQAQIQKFIVAEADLVNRSYCWTWAQGAGSAVDEFRLKVGTASGTYSQTVVVPFSSVSPTGEYCHPVISAVTSKGKYFSVVTAANEIELQVVGPPASPSGHKVK
jgi:hypothetical protein